MTHSSRTTSFFNSVGVTFGCVSQTDDAGELEVIQQTLTSPVKQFLCENKEGWMFYVYVSPADKQNRPKKEKGRETISLPRIKMAADTKKEMEDWSRFLWDRGLEGRRKQMINGFLWIKKAKVWQRYYCIADAHYFEWFEPQKFVRAPSLVSHERIVDVCCVCRACSVRFRSPI